MAAAPPTSVQQLLDRTVAITPPVFLARHFSPFRVLHHEQAVAPESWVSEVNSSLRRHFLLSSEDEFELADSELDTHLRQKFQVPVGNLRAGREYILCVAKSSCYHSALTEFGLSTHHATNDTARYFSSTQISEINYVSAENRATTKFEILVDVGVVNEGDHHLFQTGLRVRSGRPGITCWHAKLSNLCRPYR